MPIMHVTTQGTPHRVRCGADGRKVEGSWPAEVPGEPAQPPAMPKWLAELGWRWCGSCTRLVVRDRKRDVARLEVERLKNRMALRQ